MALARALHHSAQPAKPVVVGPSEGEVRETYDALRRLKAPLPGKHPGVLKEPEVQLEAVTVGYVAAGAPRLVVASLAGGDEVDATTTKYLLKCALRKRQKEEEEERRRKQREEEEELHKQVQRVIDASSSSGKRRKKKKRRKRKTPKSSSSCGRARRRQRQWHVSGPCALQRQVPAVPRVHCVSLRHVVDVPVVRFVLFPQVLFFGFYADWISSNDEICADNYIYFRFKLKGKGRSEQWEAFLYCDKTIKVDRDSEEVLPRGVPPPGICCVGFGSSPYLATDYTIYQLCLPSECGMGMCLNLADPVLSGCTAGRACPRFQLWNLPRCPSHSL